MTTTTTTGPAHTEYVRDLFAVLYPSTFDSECALTYYLDGFDPEEYTLEHLARDVALFWLTRVEDDLPMEFLHALRDALGQVVDRSEP